MLERIFDRGQFVLGPEVRAFERECAEYFGVAHAVALASGTDALALALRACGIGPGDEVITTPFSFIAPVEAIVAVGAVPVFADIDPASYTLDPARVESALTRKTRAILPVHLYGHPCALEPLMRLAARHGIPLIEDCAQAFGARYQGRAVGTFGAIGCFSFYPTKNLGGCGDGGMVITNHGRLAEHVRLLREHGSRQRYRHLVIGTNSRLDELQAAILRVKLRRVDRWNAARRRHARMYDARLRRLHWAGISVPTEAAGGRHVYHLYTIRARRRAALQRALERNGIATQVAYPSTLPSQPALRRVRRRVTACPVAARAAREVLSLPLYPELTARDIAYVVRAVARASRTGAA